MSNFRTLERTGFYKELTPEKQQELFSYTEKKILPAIDNLYFNVHVQGDNDEYILPGLLELIERVSEVKEEVKKHRKPISFFNGLNVTIKSAGSGSYNLCLTNENLYDIFIKSGNLTNNDTPRMHVQLRAIGLWTIGIDAALLDAYKKVCALLADFGLAVAKVRENRVDYCYHTNIVSGINKIFNTKEGYAKHMHTKMTRFHSTGDVEKLNDGYGSVLSTDYIRFGEHKSKNYLVRFYDKAREVIENGYKTMFFKLWYDNGLISYYDKWCMEYVAPHKKMKYFDKARVAFYVEHGTNPEKVFEFKQALDNPKTTFDEFKRLAHGFMPKVTAVINIEFQTMRKFYKYSDSFIDGREIIERENTEPMLQRIYKIIDNRGIFTEYLTRQGISFYDGVNKDGTRRYLDWWKRIRNVKMQGIKADIELLREYSNIMDKAAVYRKLVNTVASIAVYEDRLETDFKEDGLDALSNLTDNKARKMDTELLDCPVHENIIRNYSVKKEQKEILLKSRKQAIKDYVAANTSNVQAILMEFDELPMTAEDIVIDIDNVILAEILDDDDELLPDEWI